MAGGLRQPAEVVRAFVQTIWDGENKCGVVCRGQGLQTMYVLALDSLMQAYGVSNIEAFLVTNYSHKPSSLNITPV